MTPETPTDADGCLSHSHKRAQPVSEGELSPAVLSVWRGATCSKASRELVSKRCVDCGSLFWVERYRAGKYERCVMCRVSVRECKHCGATFEVTGRELRTQKVIQCPVCGGDSAGDVRGEITRFSEKSRRELMFQLNSLKKGAGDTANFVTLTFPDSAYSELSGNLARAKDYLRLFEFRFRREFPDACYVWRLETETRKSGSRVGEIFPHFHLLIFNVGLPELRAFVPVAWHEIAGFGDKSHLAVHEHRKTVTPCYSRKAVMGYASKGVGSVMSSELAKDIQAKGGKIGRFWGTVAKEIFRSLQAVPELVEMNDGDIVQLFRFFRGFIRGTQNERYLKAVERARKAKKEPPRHPHRMKSRQVRSMTVFLDGDNFWNRVTQVLSAGVLRLKYTVTGREYDEPFWKFAYGNGLWVPSAG